MFNHRYSQANKNVIIQLLSARDMAQRTVIGKENIIYSTEKDLDEQDYETREWARRFEELERSDWEALTNCEFRKFFASPKK